jgi:hypothetical protein
MHLQAPGTARSVMEQAAAEKPIRGRRPHLVGPLQRQRAELARHSRHRRGLQCRTRVVDGLGLDWL